MASIRPSSDLRNKYNEISDFCHSNDEPVYITKNGKGDLAVMSIEVFEQLSGKQELIQLLGVGLKESKAGKSIPAETVFASLEK